MLDRSHRSRRPLPVPAVSSLLRTGWLPAVGAVLVIGALAREHGAVAGRDILAFAIYVGCLLTLPGTLLWRAVHRRVRPLAEDLALGTTVGFALELPAYLAARAVGQPYLVFLVPVLAVVLSLALPAGRRLWHPGTPMPPAWSWTVAGAAAASAVLLAHASWSVRPVSGVSLRTPYVDEPFQLALVGELRHHFPAQIPFVDGTPLLYHWFTHAHLASASWVSDLDPVVLLRVLDPLLMVVLATVALAAAVSRLARTAWAGPVAALLLVASVPLDLAPWTPITAPWTVDGFVSPLVHLSPTHTYGTLLLVPILLLTLERLGEDREPAAERLTWALLFGLVAVVAGAKSSVLAVLLAGLAGVTLLQLLIRRRLPARPLGLLAGSVAVFLAAKALLYGSGDRSLEVNPLATSGYFAERLGLAAVASPGPAAGVAVALMLAVAWLAPALGALALLKAGGWRRPDVQFLLVTVAAGLAATFTFDHPGRSQLYFLYATVPMVAFAGALGLARAVGHWPQAARLRLGVVSTTGGGALFLGHAALEGLGPQPGLRAAALHVLGASAVVLAVAVLASRWLRAPGRTRAVVLATAAALALGMSVTTTAVRLAGSVLHEWPRPVAAPVGREAPIGTGGVAAARWLRANSDPGDLVATNAHCRVGGGERCDRRHFWISGYAQRRVLVEGWAYVPPESVGQPSTPETNSVRPPFWDPELLAANDRAFESPSPATVGELRDRHGVDWLFVDLRYPHDLAGLEERADLRYKAPEYAVLEMRND